MSRQQDEYNVPVSHLGTGSQQSQRGCLFYGCLTVFCLVLFSVISGSIMLFLGARQLARVVAENAEDQPIELPVVAASDEEIDSLKKRLKEFGDALDNEKAEAKEIQPLELTELQINQLIQDEEELKGVVYIDLEPEMIKGKISLPLDEFGRYFKKLKGKYLNGEGEFTAEITDQGFLDVHLVKIRLGDGKELPAEAQLQLRKENLASRVNSNADLIKMLRKLDKIEILKDKLRLLPRKSVRSGGVSNDDGFDKAVDEFKEKAESGSR